jgi:hypothetical protein
MPQNRSVYAISTAGYERRELSVENDVTCVRLVREVVNPLAKSPANAWS